MSKRVLIIEDDQEIADLVAMHLTDLSFECEQTGDGREGAERAVAGNFSLVILDIMLPSMDGFEVCKHIRKEREDLPILMLTAKTDEVERILGLELGADDYVTKPFSVRELGARVKAILRRTETRAAVDEHDGGVITSGGLSIDLSKRRVRQNDRVIEVTAKEFDLLVLFASHPGRVFNRSELLDKVWGYQFEGYGHTVNSHINRLRAKIESNPAEPTLIETVWGVGYRFHDESDDR